MKFCLRAASVVAACFIQILYDSLSIGALYIDMGTHISQELRIHQWKLIAHPVLVSCFLEQEVLLLAATSTSLPRPGKNRQEVVSFMFLQHHAIMLEIRVSIENLHMGSILRYDVAISL